MAPLKSERADKLVEAAAFTRTLRLPLHQRPDQVSARRALLEPALASGIPWDAGVQVGDGVVECGMAGQGSRGMVNEDLVAVGRGQRVELRLGGLVMGRYPCVSHQSHGWTVSQTDRA